MCVRTGKRGGDSIYIIGKDPTFEIKVTAGKNVTKFSRYFEGRTLEVYGYVRHVGDTYTPPNRKTSSGQHKTMYTYAQSDYYIECDKYARIGTINR